MEMPMKAGNAGAVECVDDGARPRHTGTFWTGSAHITTAVIGSGVLSLQVIWAIAQLGWVAGPAAILLFAFVIGSGVLSLVWAIAQLGWAAGPAAILLFAFVTYFTATLLAVALCYRTGDPDKGKRNYYYMDAVRSILSGAKVAICGVIQYGNLVGVAIGYSIASSIRRPACFHSNGHAYGCKSSSTTYMVVFGAMLILLLQIPEFDQISGPSIAAAVMYFINYSSIGLYLVIAQSIYNDGFGAGVTLLPFGLQLCFLLIETPPPSESKVMQKATRLSVATTTIFYMLRGCMGYAAFGDAAPDNVTSFGFWVNLVLSNRSPSSRCVLIQAILSVMLSAACLALAECMCIWIRITMLSPACCIGRSSHHSSYRPATPGSSSRVRMPRTDAIKGSHKCIGRAGEVVPTGRRGHAFVRATLPPRKCDWYRIMGSTVINRDDSCVISASVMCMEAQYRRPNGKYHGANSCSLKVMPEAVKCLKDMCERMGAWKPYFGALKVEGVLNVILLLEKGIRTVYDNISLRLKSYETFKAGDLSPLEVTSKIQENGPVIGVLYVDDEAYYRSTVYRGGDRVSRANHAVVCTGYRYVDGELCIIIMDNMAPGGPFRFVLHEAFEEFHVLTVDAS